MLTNISIEEFAILAESLRGFLKSYVRYKALNMLFHRSTIRNIARILEKDNPYYITAKSKLNKMLSLIKNDEFYSAHINLSPTAGDFNKSTNICKTFKKILNSSYENLPLVINEEYLEDTGKIILNWRFKIKK